MAAVTAVRSELSAVAEFEREDLAIGEHGGQHGRIGCVLGRARLHHRRRHLGIEIGGHWRLTHTLDQNVGHVAADGQEFLGRCRWIGSDCA